MIETQHKPESGSLSLAELRKLEPFMNCRGRVYCWMCAHSDAAGSVCGGRAISSSLIARELGICKNSVCAALIELEKAGQIERVFLSGRKSKYRVRKESSQQANGKQ